MKQSVNDHVHIPKDYLVRYIINYRMYVFAFALIYQKQREPMKGMIIHNESKLIN